MSLKSKVFAVQMRTATPSSILHPLLLPSLHPTVFTMFAQVVFNAYYFITCIFLYACGSVKFNEI